MRAQSPSQSAVRGYNVKQFLGATSILEVAVSPDGRQVAFTTTSDDFETNRTVVTVWREEVDGTGKPGKAVRVMQDPGQYRAIRWSPDSRTLAFVAERTPGDTARIMLAAIGSDTTRPPLVVALGFSIAAYAWDIDSKSVLVAAPQPLPDSTVRERKRVLGDAQLLAQELSRTDIYRISVVNGFAQQRLGSIASAVSELVPSPDGRTIAIITVFGARGFGDSFADAELYLLSSDSNKLADDTIARPLTHNLIVESDVSWSADGSALYISGVGDSTVSHSINTQSHVYRVARFGGGLTPLGTSFVGDMRALSQNTSTDGSVLASCTGSTATNACLVASTGALRQLSTVHGQLTQLSVSRNRHVAFFVLSSTQAFPELFVAPGIDHLGEAHQVSRFNAALDSVPQPMISTVRWPNGEGDTVEGVLFRPRAHKAPLPLIVDLHGGPWSLRQEELGTNSTGKYFIYPSLLASRGYIVLEPNYRGSVGRGDAYVRALEGHSCSRPTADVLTGVDFVVRQGIVDTTRMAIIGTSYGGIVTNCVIGRTTRFAAASTTSGEWNSTSYFGSADNFIQTDTRFDGRAPWEAESLYWEESPISRAAHIRTPTLVIAGGSDRRVPTTQSYETYRALMRLGVPTEMLLLPSEPHVFRSPLHRLTKVTVELAWLERYIGEGRP